MTEDIKTSLQKMPLSEFTNMVFDMATKNLPDTTISPIFFILAGDGNLGIGTVPQFGQDRDLDKKLLSKMRRALIERQAKRYAWVMETHVKIAKLDDVSPEQLEALKETMKVPKDLQIEREEEGLMVLAVDINGQVFSISATIKQEEGQRRIVEKQSIMEQGEQYGPLRNLFAGENQTKKSQH